VIIAIVRPESAAADPAPASAAAALPLLLAVPDELVQAARPRASTAPTVTTRLSREYFIGIPSSVWREDVMGQGFGGLSTCHDSFVGTFLQWRHFMYRGDRCQ
jgi:hypothetical protein